MCARRLPAHCASVTPSCLNACWITPLPPLRCALPLLHGSAAPHAPLCAVSKPPAQPTAARLMAAPAGAAGLFRRRPQAQPSSSSSRTSCVWPRRPLACCACWLRGRSCPSTSCWHTWRGYLVGWRPWWSALARCVRAGRQASKQECQAAALGAGCHAPDGHKSRSTALWWQLQAASVHLADLVGSRWGMGLPGKDGCAWHSAWMLAQGLQEEGVLEAVCGEGALGLLLPKRSAAGNLTAAGKLTGRPCTGAFR